MNIFQIFLDSSLMAQIIITVLIVFSIWSWAIFLKKLFDFSKISRLGKDFLSNYRFRNTLKEMETLGNMLEDNPYGRVLRSGLDEYKKLASSLPAGAAPHVGGTDAALNELSDNLRLAMDKTKLAELAEVEKMMPALGTFVSVSPFLGLLGTVWGIMVAFLDIRTRGSAHITVVAPGISDALVTTVYGLLVAIPALIFYNIFRTRINKLDTELSKFINEIFGLLRGKLLTRHEQ